MEKKCTKKYMNNKKQTQTKTQFLYFSKLLHSYSLFFCFSIFIFFFFSHLYSNILIYVTVFFGRRREGRVGRRWKSSILYGTDDDHLIIHFDCAKFRHCVWIFTLHQSSTIWIFQQRNVTSHHVRYDFKNCEKNWKF